MKDVKAPSVGESITEVSILKWAKEDGQLVKNGELLLEIESDKATVEVVAEATGRLQILKAAGERIAVGAIIGRIDETANESATADSVPKVAVSAKPAAPASGMTGQPGPGARKLADELGVDWRQAPGSGRDGRLTVGDLVGGKTAPSVGPARPEAVNVDRPGDRSRSDREGDRRVPMSNLRARIAERLVAAQHTAAILTTFNEVDLGAVNAVRAQHKDAFKTKHGVPLSYMSFFARAVCVAMKEVPEVNASIDGKDIVYHDYVDLGIAVGTERGLVVPIIRGAEKLGFVEIEKAIAEMALKARNGKLSIADLSGGTFTISNGGTYGSLLSTPILTPPQSGILGMHKIQDRPVAVAGKVEIRPMMYLALSYDHRLIDGKGAVTFLVKLREALEKPDSLGFQP